MALICPPLVDTTLLTLPLRTRVLNEYRTALRTEDRPMSYVECAWLYGYQYNTIRWLVHKKRLKCRKRGQKVLITHAQMRVYQASKSAAGAPRKALLIAQTQLA